MVTLTAEAPTLADLDPRLLVSHNYRALDRDRCRRMAELWNPAMLDPIRVAPMDGGRWEVVDGDHRREAAVLAGVDTVPCVILPVAPSSADALLASVAGNLCASASSAAEDAQAFGELVAAGLTVETIAGACSRTVSYVTRRLALLDLDPSVRFIADRHGLSWAEPLRGLPGNVQCDLVRILECEGLNRARWCELVDQYRADAAARAAEQDSMFGGDFGLAVQEWSTDRAGYIDSLTAEDPAPDPVAPVVIREEVLGLSDLADRIGAKRATAYKWQQRGQLPAPDLTVSGQPAWWASTVDAWWSTRS